MSERLNLASSGGKDQEDDEYECQVCNANLFVSLVSTFDDHGDDDSFDDNDDNNDDDVHEYKCRLCKSSFPSWVCKSLFIVLFIAQHDFRIANAGEGTYDVCDDDGYGDSKKVKV